MVVVVVDVVKQGRVEEELKLVKQLKLFLDFVRREKCCLGWEKKKPSRVRCLFHPLALCSCSIGASPNVDADNCSLHPSHTMAAECKSIPRHQSSVLSHARQRVALCSILLMLQMGQRLIDEQSLVPAEP